MRLIDAEKVAESLKSTGQKYKDDAKNIMMSNNAEDFIKCAIEEVCAEMLIGLADSLLKDVPSDPIYEAFFEWRNPETDPPKVETEVLILYRNDIDGYGITTAHYEDGSVFLQDSVWYWEDLPDWGTYDLAAGKGCPGCPFDKPTSDNGDGECRLYVPDDWDF